MPRMAVDKDYRFEGPDGPASLLDLFEGRRQLILYRFFFEPGVRGWPEHGCRLLVPRRPGRPPGAPERPRHHARVRLARAAARHRALEGADGVDIPWYTITDDFDADFGVDEWHGTNAFFRDGDRVFRTYFINSRGDEAMGSTWSYLDVTALGRQEEWRTRRRATRRRRPISGGTSTTSTAMGGSARLIHSAIASVDGYVADDQGKFDWAAPDAEVHSSSTPSSARSARTVRAADVRDDGGVGDRPPPSPPAPEPMRDFAEIWRAAEKVVYTNLETPSTRRTRIEREFDPEAVRRMKASAGGTSRSAAPTSQARRSERGWSTNATCSWPPSSWEAASGHCQSRCGWSSSCWPHVGSTEGWSICTTGEGSAAGFESTSWCYLSPLPEDAVRLRTAGAAQQDLDREVRIDVVVTHEADHRAPRQRFDLTGHLGPRDLLPAPAQVQHGL